MLSIAVNPEDYSQLQCGGITVTQHSSSSTAPTAQQQQQLSIITDNPEAVRKP